MNTEEIKRVKIPDSYEYLGEFYVCPNCKADGCVYADLRENEDNTISGDYLCTWCEYEWSKV